jgi:biopolymer transport protein ExbD
MAAKLPGGDTDDLGAISDINVTPFVDVVLVLLVIFMVTAPMLVREQMAVNLPKAQSGEKSASESLSIGISKEGTIQISGKAVMIDQIVDEIKLQLQNNPNAQAVISADQDTKHGDVVRVIDEIKKAGLNRFAIQIERK